MRNWICISMWCAAITSVYVLPFPWNPLVGIALILALAGVWKHLDA